MPWSTTSRDDLLRHFLPRFSTRQRCVDSLDRYVKTATALDERRAADWLERDLAKDRELAAIADPEDTHVGLSRYDLNGCYHCYGRGFVRKDVDIHHADFGRAFPCPTCTGVSPASIAAHCPNCARFTTALAANPDRNQCWKCRRYEDEAAGESCPDPRWHLPNANLPAPDPPLGWKRLI